MKIDKEFKSLIPPLGAEELAQLEENLKRDGCRDALVTWNDLLLDGHNRKAICERLDISYKEKAIKLDDRDAALIWIIDNQKGRRNIADIDRIALQKKKHEILSGIGKKNQKARKGNQPGATSAKLPNLPIDSRKESAAAAGVGERTYDAGKMVLDAAEKGEIDQKEVEAIRRKEKSIHRVAKDIKEKRQKAQRQEKRQQAIALAPKNDERIIVGDFRKLSDHVANDSLSLIFTDPPYDRKSEELFDGLGNFAADKLMVGGSLICYIGHIQIRAALNSLCDHLRFWWVCACVHEGDKALLKEYGIRAGWKPMLWFVKGTRDDKSNIVSDTVSGKTEKDQHDWQQAQSEAEYWIKNLCPKDGIVCDPFLGGGTTGAAANALKRKWIGFEIDPTQAKIAAERCGD